MQPPKTIEKTIPTKIVVKYGKVNAGSYLWERPYWGLYEANVGISTGVPSKGCMSSANVKMNKKYQEMLSLSHFD